MKNDKKKILEEIDKTLGEDKTQEILAFLKSHRKEVVEAYKENLQKQNQTSEKIDDLILIFATKLDKLIQLLDIANNKDLQRVEVINQVIPPSEVSVNNLAEINIPTPPSEISLLRPEWVDEIITIINSINFRKILDSYTTAKNPLAVRLSDGEKFIEKLTSLYQAVAGGTVDQETKDILQQIADNTDELEIKAENVNLNTDELEDLITTGNSSLANIDINTDEVETKLDDAITELQNIITTLGSLTVVVAEGQTKWQKEVGDGHGFEVTTNSVTVTPGTETAFILIRNPGGSGKTVQVKRFIYGLDGPAAQRSIYRFYRTPTVTVVGTALTIHKIIFSQANSSVINIYRAPTVTGNGTLIETTAVKGESPTLDDDRDMTFYIEQGQDILITVDGSTTGMEQIFNMRWAEV
jgi:DNA gyrase/topoisomerase IV subunit A